MEFTVYAKIKNNYNLAPITVLSIALDLPEVVKDFNFNAEEPDKNVFTLSMLARMSDSYTEKIDECKKSLDKIAEDKEFYLKLVEKTLPSDLAHKLLENAKKVAAEYKDMVNHIEMLEFQFDSFVFVANFMRDEVNEKNLDFFYSFN